VRVAWVCVAWVCESACRWRSWKQQWTFMHQNHVAMLLSFAVKLTVGNPSEQIMTVAKRLLNGICQRIDVGLRGKGSVSPSPLQPESDRAHPCSLESRQSGSKAFAQELVRRFMTRGGGFVTVAGEQDLMSCGITPETSKVAGRLTGEYVARMFYKSSAVFSEFLNSQTIPSIVLVQDASTVFRVPVPVPRGSVLRGRGNGI
jgi:hypothetical protein